MTDSEFITAWLVVVALVAVVILIAAGLLLAILLTARSILGHGAEALEAAEHIAADTQVIWALADTNAVAGEILATAEQIEANGAAIASALRETEAGPVSVLTAKRAMDAQ